MTDQELIKRLRVDEPACEEHFTANLAADRIEELVKERKAMAMRDAGYDVYAGLEAKLTKAGEALRDTTQMLSQCTFTIIRMKGQYFDRHEVIDKARAVLAELEGK